MKPPRALSTLLGITLSVLCQGDPVQPPSTAIQGKDQLLALIDAEFKPADKKDEFETTEQFEQRQQRNAGKDFLITVAASNNQLLGPKALFYVADTQTVTVTLRGDSFIEAIKVFDVRKVEANKTMSPEALSSGRYTKFTLKSTAPAVEKEYDAQNAMGAHAKVKTVKNTFSAVAFLNMPESLTQPFPSVSFKMPPDDARQLFARAQWQLVLRTYMAPAQKGLVVYDGSYTEPTITDPYELYTVGKTITATMQRAELIDPQTGAILATFLPKGSGSDAINTGVALGVKMAPMTPAIVTSMGLDSANGALVASVSPGSAADKAGLKEGDVLVRIGNTPIKGPADVQAAVAEIAPGGSAVLEVIRQHSRSTIKVQF
jgi:hypothetical protein